MGLLPTGTVTFLFTDIEGSTRLLEHLGDDAFDVVLREHHRIMREAISAHRGVEVRTVGDAFFVVFPAACDAVATALAAQIGLGRVPWPDGAIVRTRMGLHTGLGRLGGDDYVGLAVHHAARVASAAHGGQIVVSEATMHAADVSAARASWRALGCHRLKDLGAGVELFQLCHPALTADFPPLRSLERVAHNFPIQLSSFLGRDDDLLAGAKLLSATRALSVVGPGGTGKTRLAYQLAAEQLDEFPDGVWVVELASVSDPGLVPASLMAAMGMRDEPGRTATETIVSHLSSRHALVVLDNCEHVIDAAAELTVELLSGCARLHVLATSREPLRIAGESVWALGALALPEHTEARLEALAANDAVALFCERAAEAKVGFALNADNAAAVMAICSHVEGIPLAIELAAARVRTLPLAQIAERLQHSLDLLSHGTRGAAERQASVRGAIAWSHDMLTPAERVVFRRLAVFAGGFTLDAAEAVCSGDGFDVGEVAAALEALVDKSLVTLGQDLAHDDRYRLLEPIRVYAAERLEIAAELLLVAAGHAVYFGALAHDCAEGDGWGVALDRLEVDHSNLLAALDHLSGSDRPVEHGQLLVDLSSFWRVRGHWQLARRELLRYLDRGDRDRAFECRCVLQLGNVAENLGDHVGARAHFEEALSIARELGDRLTESTCLGSLGNVASHLGDEAVALARYEEALSIAREIGDRSLQGLWIGNLGNAAADAGDSAGAKDRYEEALSIARELGSRGLEGAWLGNLGSVALELGDVAVAQVRFEEALRIAVEFGDRSREGRWLANLGTLASNLGDSSKAAALLEDAVSIARELGDRQLEAACVGNLGEAAYELGDIHTASALFVDALDIGRELGDRRLEQHCVGWLGCIAAELGDHRGALDMFIEALNIGREFAIGDRNLLVGCAGLLARLDRCEDAARLLAAAGTVDASVHGVSFVSAQARYDSTVATCREKLGETAVAMATKRGSALSWTAAADLASGALERRRAVLDFSTRRAVQRDASVVADVWLRSRRSSIPSIPPPVHSEKEVREWFATVVLPTRPTWVVEHHGDVVALLVLDGGWVDQLYVDPGFTGRGLGSELLDIAKEHNAEGLDLWTFQANDGARRFYERHGFASVAMTDGDNEEGAPDVHYRWRQTR